MLRQITSLLVLSLLTPALAQQPPSPTTNRSSFPSANPPPGITPLGTTGRFIVNFRDATLDTVLYELAGAFGLSVIKVSPMGNERIASIVNLQGLTQTDAVTLINVALNELNYAAIQKGNVLHIERRAEALTRDLPVRRFDSPRDVPMTDELMTAVIPLRSINATQLVQELQPLINPQTIVAANASSNALIITDVTSTIHRIASIVAELDAHRTEASAVAVIHLEHSSAADVARVINELYRPAPTATPRGGQPPAAQTGARRGGGRRGGEG